MAACRTYPFATGNARMFAQDLIEYVLNDFGHIWKAERSHREKCLRESSMFSFSPVIGKAVSHFSRKHGGFVVMVCYNTWKYIKSHRACVFERMLSHEIVLLCERCELENDDLGLFIFMALVVEYTRFAIVYEQKQLVESVANTLGYCIAYVIPGGFTDVLQRMYCCASALELPNSVPVSESETPCTNPVSRNSVNSSEFESPLNFMYDFSIGSQYNAPLEEIEQEVRKRELRRELHNHALLHTAATQTNFEDMVSCPSCEGSIYPQCEVLKVTKIEEENKPGILNAWLKAEAKTEVKDVGVQTEELLVETSCSRNSCGEVEISDGVSKIKIEEAVEATEEVFKDVKENVAKSLEETQVKKLSGESHDDSKVLTDEVEMSEVRRILDGVKESSGACRIPSLKKDEIREVQLKAKMEDFSNLDVEDLPQKDVSEREDEQFEGTEISKDGETKVCIQLESNDVVSDKN